MQHTSRALLANGVLEPLLIISIWISMLKYGV